MEKTNNNVLQTLDLQVVVAEVWAMHQSSGLCCPDICRKDSQGLYESEVSGSRSLLGEETLLFPPLYSEDKQYEVRWLFKPTGATSSSSRKVQRSVYVGAGHTLVWRQLWEEPEPAAAAPDVDEGSSSLDSLCSSLWRPRLMWLCRAAGVNHSLGRQLCRKGMQELK